MYSYLAYPRYSKSTTNLSPHRHTAPRVEVMSAYPRSYPDDIDYHSDSPSEWTESTQDTFTSLSSYHSHPDSVQSRRSHDSYHSADSATFSTLSSFLGTGSSTITPNDYSDAHVSARTYTGTPYPTEYPVLPSDGRSRVPGHYDEFSPSHRDSRLDYRSGGAALPSLLDPGYLSPLNQRAYGEQTQLQLAHALSEHSARGAGLYDNRPRSSLYPLYQTSDRSLSDVTVGGGKFLDEGGHELSDGYDSDISDYSRDDDSEYYSDDSEESLSSRRSYSDGTYSDGDSSYYSDDLESHQSYVY